MSASMNEWPLNIDFSRLTPVGSMFGEDLEEAQQLTALCEEAELYLASFAWCDGIRNAYFGLGVSDFVGIFLFEILPSDASRGSFHWVVAGDIPPASLSVDRCSDSALALRLYIEEMKSWCQAVLEERPVGQAIHVNLPATVANARELMERMASLESVVLSNCRLTSIPKTC
jgi:hypothetical protein